METIVRDVRNLDQSDRNALERVVGHTLGGSERLVIQVMTLDTQTSQAPPIIPPELPDWTSVYEGLSDEQIDVLDAAIRSRANLTRNSTDAE